MLLGWLLRCSVTWVPPLSFIGLWPMMLIQTRICNRLTAGNRGTVEVTQDWDQPHWSGRPQPKPDTRKRIRPNVFARLARFCLWQSHAAAVSIVAFAILAALYAGLNLTVDPSLAPRVGLDAHTLAAQAELDRKFPGIDETL